MTQIALINSSVQQKNYTGFILKIIENELIKRNSEVINIRLQEFSLPFPGEEINNDDSSKLIELLRSANAYIVGCPEYNGSFTAKLKLMIENSGYPSEFKGKPVGLVGLASGVLGATKSLEQLRTVYSHIGSIVLPRVVSIAQVEKQFDDSGYCINNYVKKNIELAAENMIGYLDSLKSI